MKTLTRKIVLSAAVLLLAVSALFSCQFPLVPPKDDGKVEYTRLVAAKDSIDVTELSEISSVIFNISGPVSVVTDDESATDGEIVFGDADREITEKAKEKMQAQFKKEGAECGYIIYAEGKNVAVYWTDEDMKEPVLAQFLAECVEKSELELEMGIVLHQGYTTKEYSQEKYWLALEAQGCDEETLAALRSLNSFFNGSTYVEWMANLWDDGIGGFYYSDSARNNEPYRPDLESTNQLTNWIVAQKATGSLGRNEFLPNEIKLKIVKFIKEMQRPENGYFLHPQWSQNINSLGLDRYGRDLSWATSMLKAFTVDTDGDGVEEKQYPNWCTPSGLKCEKHVEGGTCDYSTSTVSSAVTGFSKTAADASAAITVSLRDTRSGAAAKLMRQSSNVTAVASSRPDYSSSEAFTQWLYDYNGGFDGMLPNSGNAHQINALQDEIIAKGFGDELVAFLDDMQEQIYEYQVANDETPTCVWQNVISYRAVWGVLKYMPFYNSSVCGKEIPLDMALGMVRTCIEVIKLGIDEAKPYLNDLMNQWSGLNQILANVKKYSGDYGAEKVYELVRANAADLIYASMDKLEHYKLDNGLLAYAYTRKSLSVIYETPISLGAEEADVNGATMISGQYSSIFSSLGYSMVPLCTEVDGENFLRIVQNLEPVEKVPVPKGETITFDDDSILSSISSSVYTTGFEMGIVPDPSDASNNTLLYKSGEGHPTYGDTLTIKTTGLGGNCFIVEFDVYFKNITGESGKDIFQVSIGSLYMFTMGYSGDNVYLGWRTGTAGTDLANSSFAVGKKNDDGWCKVRLELYYPDTNEDGELKTKFFINDEYMGTDNHHRGSSINTSFSQVNFVSRKDFTTEIYFDNCFFNLENKIYYADDHEITDSRD